MNYYDAYHNPDDNHNQCLHEFFEKVSDIFQSYYDIKKVKVLYHIKIDI